jgi:hypothetical protein
VILPIKKNKRKTALICKWKITTFFMDADVETVPSMRASQHPNTVTNNPNTNTLDTPHPLYPNHAGMRMKGVGATIAIKKHSSEFARVVVLS